MLITFIWLDSLWNLMLMLCCWHLCFEALTLQAWHTIHTCFNAVMPLAKPTMKSLLKVALNQSCHCITHWNESISLISWFWNGSHNWQCSVSQTLLPSPNFNHATPTLKATAAATAIWHRPLDKATFHWLEKLKQLTTAGKRQVTSGPGRMSFNNTTADRLMHLENWLKSTSSWHEWTH